MSSYKSIQASVFKAKCLEILDHVPSDGIIITKHGQPVARLIPISSTGSILDLYGSMKNEIKVHGDLETTGTKWNAES
jgi:prevent-host-death family protein